MILAFGLFANGLIAQEIADGDVMIAAETAPADGRNRGAMTLCAWGAVTE